MDTKGSTKNAKQRIIILIVSVGEHLVSSFREKKVLFFL